MKDKRKIVPIVILVVLIVTLVSTIVLSSVYAKYVTEGSADPSTVRPASFDIVMNTPMEDKIEVDFSAGGEPGNPIGHTMVYKDFDFSVVTSGSEVAADYILGINFDYKTSGMINQARKDKFADGICFDYVVIRGEEVKNDDGTVKKDSNGNPVIKYEDKNIINVQDTGTDLKKWKYTSTIEPLKNPDDSTGTAGAAYYRLRLIVYNNTMMPLTGNTDHYFLSTDGIEIEVISKQIDPKYSSNY